MAVPTTRITDPSPERTYRCARCNQDVPLSGYRRLYRGTKRPLRCRACEAATTTSPRLARYYAYGFEQDRQTKQQYNQRRPEVIQRCNERYLLSHADERREYRQAWLCLNREHIATQAQKRYLAQREERLARARVRYAARTQTPEVLAVRAAAREQRGRERRATWRVAVREAVATYYNTPPYSVTAEALLVPPPRKGSNAHALTEARRLAIYCCWVFHRSRDRHPKAEIAAEFNCSTHSLSIIIGSVRVAIRRRSAGDDGMDLYVALKAVCEAMDFRFGHHGQTAARPRLEKVS